MLCPSPFPEKPAFIYIALVVEFLKFAYMIISLALLGYGASGTFIAVLRTRLEPRFEAAFAASALLFSIAMIACFIAAQRIPFNALEIVWDRGQLLNLAAVYLVFFVPFFFAACCIGLAFTCRGHAASRIYFFDLFGAGLGAVLIIVLLFRPFGILGQMRRDKVMRRLHGE